MENAKKVHWQLLLLLYASQGLVRSGRHITIEQREPSPTKAVAKTDAGPVRPAEALWHLNPEVRFTAGRIGRNNHTLLQVSRPVLRHIELNQTTKRYTLTPRGPERATRCELFALNASKANEILVGCSLYTFSVCVVPQHDLTD